MANEKRLIDANKIQFEPYIDPLHSYPIMNKILFVGRSSGKTIAMVQEILKKTIDNQPTVDAVEVVRCKDCKHLEIDPGLRYDKRMCLMRGGEYGYCKDDDFCSYGERRDGV